MLYNKMEIIWILGKGMDLCNLFYYLHLGKNTCKQVYQTFVSSFLRKLEI